ncbi:hypothetical protein F5Y18DRAFT_440733 [Xylariaceae sp. FL1019]|nr:hypothetical protein F5Y18DRAFT_440733 [Xylariaceae sp. FL1019]
MSSNNSNSSNVSSPSYGYDFVVSTTQTAINKSLWKYLSSGKEQSVTQLCFLVNPKTGFPSEYIAIEDLMKKHGTVNPFDILPGTNYNDPRIAALTAALFSTGIQLKVGPPPGVSSDNLPGIVSLAEGTKAVEFNIDIDKELSTTYFQQHSNEKEALLAQLSGLENTGTAFSLPQLLFDVNNAALQGEVRFEGIPDGNPARSLLEDATLALYKDYTKEQGNSLLALTALPHIEDQSQLELTGIERQVSFLKDSAGQELKDPSPEQLAVTTLDYLCAMDYHPHPGAKTFNWNWVMPEDVNRASGVISINRNTLGNSIMNEILPSCQQSCIIAHPTVSTGPSGEVHIDCSEIENGGMPQQTTITSQGASVIHIEYVHDSVAKDTRGAYYGRLEVTPHFTCDVSFVGTQMIVRQHPRIRSGGRQALAAKRSISQTYDVKVDGGALKITPVPGSIHIVENSEEPDRSDVTNTFTHINDIVKGDKAKIYNFSRPLIGEIHLNRLEKFIFPGGKVFSYSSARFSNYQDLVCSITYL